MHQVVCKRSPQRDALDLAGTTHEQSKRAIVLIDWWAPWCGPCRAFAPIFEAAAARHPDIALAKVDTEVECRLADSAGIRSIPTSMAFRDGILLLEQTGMLRGEALDELIRKLRAVDMADVRKRLAPSHDRALSATGA